MSWAERIHKQRREQEKRDKHTLLCAENFYAVLAISMWRLGYEEQDIMDVLQKMDEVYGIETDYVNTCKEETGIKVVIE